MALAWTFAASCGGWDCASPSSYSPCRPKVDKVLGLEEGADDLPRLFNRFHRGRNAAAYPGSGLGLAIVKAIITGHGGQVRAESQEQGLRLGALFAHTCLITHPHLTSRRFSSIIQL